MRAIEINRERPCVQLYNCIACQRHRNDRCVANCYWTEMNCTSKQVQIQNKRKTLSKMEIVLSDNRTQYETGQEVTGVLRVPMLEDIKADNLSIELIGLAEVKWFEILSKAYVVAGSVLEEPPQVFHQTKECLHLINNVSDEGIIASDFNDEFHHSFTDIEKSAKSKGSIAHEIPFLFNLPPR